MAVQAQLEDVTVDEITQEDGMKLLDDLVRETLDMSAEDFLARLDAGATDDLDSIAVTEATILLPLARRLPA